MMRFSFMSKFSDYRAPKALLFAALSVFVLSFSISPALFAQDYVINDPSFGKVRKGVVVVKFHNGTNFYASSGRVGIAEVDRILDGAKATDVETFLPQPRPLLKGEIGPEEYSVRHMVKIFYEGDAFPSDLSAELAATAAVEYAEPYPVFETYLTPNDPMIAQQWALSAMEVPAAWEYSTSDESIVIGLIDTGVDYNHPELRDKIWTNPGEWGTSGELSNNGIDDDGNGKIDDYRGWDFYGDSSPGATPDNDPYDNVAVHGTSVIGVAAAETDNNSGMAGVGWNARFYPVKIAYDDQGMGIAGGYDGIVYATDMGLKIINCSWGGMRSNGDVVFQQFIDYARERGSLVIGSSGNDPIDNDFSRHYPSSLRYVLNVGSHEANGSRSGYATYGTSVDVYAPGSQILTTRGRSGQRFEVTQGTSLATPFASGVAALLWDLHPDWTPDQIMKQLRVTSEPTSTPRNPKFYGRLNARRALELNQNLDDIPGILITNFEFSTPSGNKFTEAGEVGTLDVTFKNVLAPTSADAEAAITFTDADQVTADPAVISLANLGTNDSVSYSIEMTLTDQVRVADGILPFRFEIEDGEYVDFLQEWIYIEIGNAWKTKYDPEDELPSTALFTAIDQATNRQVWAIARSENGTNYALRSINGGGSWSRADDGGFPQTRDVTTIHAVDGGSALLGTAGTTSSVIYRTTSSGSEWDGEIVRSTGQINGIHMWDPSNGTFVGSPRAGEWGIGITTDGGESWDDIPTPVTSDDGEFGWANSFDVRGESMWFGTNNSRIFASTDRGLTWNSYSTPGIHSVSVAFKNEMTGAVRFAEYTDEDTVTTGENGIAMTKDGGKTWNMIPTVDLSTTGFIEYEHDGMRLYAINENNVYYTRNEGQSWNVDAVPREFGSIRCSDLYVNTLGTPRTLVYAGGTTISLISTDYEFDPSTSVNGPLSVSDFAITSVYPNPYNKGTASQVFVEFNVPNTAATQLAVYDNLGRLVTKAVSAVLNAGSHSTGIDLSELPAGVYHIRLMQGDAVMTQKFSVTR